jgi:hypothetical protein
MSFVLVHVDEGHHRHRDLLRLVVDMQVVVVCPDEDAPVLQHKIVLKLEVFDDVADALE